MSVSRVQAVALFILGRASQTGTDTVVECHGKVHRLAVRHAFRANWLIHVQVKRLGAGLGALYPPGLVPFISVVDLVATGIAADLTFCAKVVPTDGAHVAASASEL